MPKKSSSHKSIAFRPIIGEFVEDKDAAAEIRKNEIEPALKEGKVVTLDFMGVGLVTQSFVHALISSVLRDRGEAALDMIEFKGCTPIVRGIIETVVQYSLDTADMTDKFSPEETSARLRKSLGAAFSKRPTHLKDIPKKDGTMRSLPKRRRGTKLRASRASAKT